MVNFSAYLYERSSEEGCKLLGGEVNTAITGGRCGGSVGGVGGVSGMRGGG